MKQDTEDELRWKLDVARDQIGVTLKVNETLKARIAELESNLAAALAAKRKAEEEIAALKASRVIRTVVRPEFVIEEEGDDG